MFMQAVSPADLSDIGFHVERLSNVVEPNPPQEFRKPNVRPSLPTTSVCKQRFGG